MKLMMRIYFDKHNRGFTAFTAVILLATGIIALSLVSTASALSFADSVNQREYRIQANLNADSCLEVAKLIVYKDYFANGIINIHDFNCDLNITNDFAGNIHIDMIADFLGIKIRREATVNILSEI